MTVDFDALSKSYDLTRNANANIVKLMLSELTLDGKNVLDFGCGTGNYAIMFRESVSANIYGVEPSDGMREHAITKGVDARKGNHSDIPFEDDFFDFIYMTDVIHHVPDTEEMFREFYRVLRPHGLICILTESYKQLESRFFVKHFPSTVDVEKTRYPDICDIIAVAEKANFYEHKTVVTDETSEVIVSEGFLKQVENKGYSMFRIISEVDYKTGLALLKKDFECKTIINTAHGETLLWLKK
ncbi:MAG: class I SAM-dependent methyltransferase [Defluviitaleaceae bacterium]|nr:class I SAM-dependent methyltransferase [Defluviitaleaceae bacterium]